MDILSRMEKAVARYGEFASTHEAMGVASEEWDEFRDAVKSNNISQIKDECLDLVAVLIRLHDELSKNMKLQKRSTK